ncbi:hypothetical protein D3C87_1752880 [compost metagenome]
MEKYPPFLPGKRQCLLQLILVGDRANPAQRIRVREWISYANNRGRQCSSGSIFQQRLGGFCWQMHCNGKESILVGASDICKPVLRDTH